MASWPSARATSSAPIQVSIVLCTHNRAELLDRTLETLRALVVPRSLGWQVVVVNNGSTDATDAVLARHAALLPLERVYEPTLGASRARNTGVGASTGELLLFTDDDVRVDPAWMTAHLDAARRWPEATFFAGRIRADFASDVPRWVRDHQQGLRGMLCALDLGPDPRPLEAKEDPWGPNMAVRRRAFESACFDPTVGRIGNNHMRGSEQSLFNALKEAGANGVWVPDAKVDHYVPRSRATLLYLLRYYAGLGQGFAQRRPDALPRLPRQIAMLAERTADLARNPSEWPPRLADIAWRIARIVETRRVMRRKELRARRSENTA